MKANPHFVAQSTGLPTCPLCEQHPLEMAIKIGRYAAVGSGLGSRQFIEKPIGATGRCNACGFVAHRDVNGSTVSTVLETCPDEPNPLLLTVFEEAADAFLVKGTAYPRIPKPPFTSPIIGTAQHAAKPGGSVTVNIHVDTSKFDAALRALKASIQTTMDGMIRDALFSTPTKKPKPTTLTLDSMTDAAKLMVLQPYTVTLEFFNDHLAHATKLTHEDLWELDNMGLLECSGRLNRITFQPLTPMFDGSLPAIAGEFRLRKQHLDEWKRNPSHSRTRP